MSESHPGDGQGGGRVPRRQMVTLRPPSLGSAQTRPPSGQWAPCPRRGWQGVGRPWGKPGRVRGGEPKTPGPSAGMGGGTRSEQCQTQALCLGVVGADWRAPKNKKQEVQGIPNPSVPLRTGSCGRRRLKVKRLKRPRVSGGVDVGGAHGAGVGRGPQQAPGGTRSRRRLQGTYARSLGTA